MQGLIVKDLDDLEHCTRHEIQIFSGTMHHKNDDSLQSGSKGLFFCKFVLIVKDLDEFEHLKVIKSKYHPTLCIRKIMLCCNHQHCFIIPSVCYFSTMFCVQT